MSKLNAKDRDKLPDSAFAGPDRSYPVPDETHAQNAKARATREEHAGRLSKTQAGKIRSKADKVIEKDEKEK